MNIVLAEQGAGGQGAERSFDKGLVRIGRDPFDSDIAFDNANYPMVSRKHAELRWNDGKWFIVDLDSSYGTFINGQRISGTQQILVGQRLQFGESGPVFTVVWFEMAQESVNSFAPPKAATPEPFSPPPVAGLDPFQSKPPLQQSIVQPPTAQTPQPQTPMQRSAAAELEFVGTGRPRFKLSSNTIWIGRETACEIRFDPGDIMVSRKHASIRFEDGNFVLEDNKSFNGTLVNEQRISAPTPLYDGDRIELGIGGPLLRLAAPGRIAPQGADLAGQRGISINQLSGLSASAIPISSKTMAFTADRAAELLSSPKESAEPQLLMSLTFGDRRDMTIGRDETSDIRLDGLQISNKHARLLKTGNEIAVEDLNSTNGVYINGARVSRQSVRPEDSIQIGTFLVRVDASGNIGVFDTRSKTRIDAVGLTREVSNRFGSGKIRLLDGISLSIQPNEFVGILGASGSGKSTLMDALNGVRPAHPGNVLINNLDLYRHFDSLKQSIGYVPQDDIIHRELSVYRTLYYVARLRLSRDVSKKEINQTINEVLDVTGLAERRNVRIDQLSGGQRKRVSMAVELITRPSVIFLDEPTSGLDPATEEKIMKLFRQIAESGRTVIMTTHAMENVKLFDKIVILMRGKLVFYGKPDEALKHLGSSSYKEIFDKLEEPVPLISQGAPDRTQQIEQTAETWKTKFLQTTQYREYVNDPLKQLGTLEPAKRKKKRRLGIFGSIRQFFTLSRRYLEVLLKDKLNLFILLAQAPIIALLTFFVMGSTKPRDFVYFVLALVAIWFGTSVSAREIIRERPIYRRERMVNLGILPYLFSKLFILGIIVSIQCLLLFLPLKFFDLTGAMRMPGEWGGLPQFGAVLITAAVGIAIGLFISALVRTSEMATSLIPLILIPQILFSGLVGVPSGINKVAGLIMPATWSFDTIKRFSTLDTLEPEGAEPNGRTGGLGLYKFTESENDRIIGDARKSLEDYQRKAEDAFKTYDDQIHNGQQNPPTPDPGVMPAIPAAKKIPADLSNYITFLHPWMNEVLNQFVLVIMFGILVILTLIILRLQDIR